MKLYFLISLFAAFLSIDHTSAPTEEVIVGETTGVGFGRPTASCDGIGICVVSSNLKIDKLEDNWGMAEFTFSRSGSVSSILVLRSSLTRNTIKKQFSGDHFIMYDPYETKLKMGGEYRMIKIPSGKHSLKETKQGFLIEIIG